jgi:cAMP-dependent protein kinase regulator
VKPILQPMMFDVFKEKPQNPILFMIEWLQNFAGIPSTRQNNVEREELENLRKEVKKYKSTLKVDDEGECSSVSSEENEEEKKKIEEEIQKKAKKKRGCRTSVSAEVYGIHNVKEIYKPRQIEKTEEQKNSIMNKCKDNFMFNCLEENELNTVLLAFEEKKYEPGDIVIKQGDQGDVLYLVDKGKLDCQRVFNPGEPPKHLKDYLPGDSFGELALLYNAPRAATIIAETDCILWALDRQCFNNIVKDAAMKKRKNNMETLKKVDILSSVDDYEVGQIADALQSKRVKANECIIKQGEEGNEFYILEEGEAYATKVTEEGKEERVKEYKRGDYFGELALLKNEPRNASIIAITECKLLYLDRKAFKRLIGPLENILQRNIEKYKDYMKK